ncbi:TolC family protein [Balneola sp. MJW-20]|uniref:TolC family protein n=1 Tax=Gracilimonas aurantiaca TaxID=3234185 RepID=UPI0034650E2D
MDRLTARIDSIASYYTEHSPIDPTGSYDLNLLKPVFQPDTAIGVLYDAEIRLLQSQKEIQENDIGIGISAGYIENLEQGVFGAEGIFYQRRANVGLEWSILKNGLLQNRDNADRIGREIALTRDEATIESTRRSYQQLFNQFLIAYNQSRSELLLQYSKILEEQQKVSSALYEMNYVSLNEVLDISSKKGTIRAEADASRRYIEQLAYNTGDYPDPTVFPIIDIDLPRLLDEGLSFYRDLPNPYSDQEFNLFSEFTLTTFLRYNLYGGSGIQNNGNELQNREFFSAGLTFSLPLPLSIDRKRSVQRQEIRIKEIENEERSELVRTEVLNQFRDYQSKLKTYRDVYALYKSQEQALRQQTILQSINSDSYSPNLLLNAISDRFATAIDLLDIKKDLYTNLIRIQTLLPERSLLNYLIPLDLDSSTELLNTRLSSYIWSVSFEKYDETAIKSFLTDNNVRTVYASGGPSMAASENISALIKNSPGLEVHLMIGDNQLIFKDHDQELESFITNAADLGVKGIHLDVEPHTFDDWDQRNSEYLQRYVEMLRRAREYSDRYSLELSVSIPTSYLPVIDEIDQLSDTVILMVYGITDADRLFRSVQDFISEVSTTFVLALRPEDFNSINELKQTLNSLNSKHRIRNIVIHDLDSWMSSQ